MSNFKELAENSNYKLLALKGAVAEYDIAVTIAVQLILIKFFVLIQLIVYCTFRLELAKSFKP